MPILKDQQVHEFGGVTIIVYSNITMRHKREGGRCHVVFSEFEKTKDDVMVEFSDNGGLCESDRTSHIDVLMDFPEERAIDNFISYLQQVKNDAYGDQGEDLELVPVNLD